MFRQLSRFMIGIAALVIAAGNPVAQDKNKKKDLPEAEKLEPYECGKVQRLHTFSGIFLASQPQPDDFRLAKEGGIKAVVNLREADELDWDEKALIEQLGMEYYHIPFRSTSSLTDDVFNKVRRLLNAKDKKPILVHCASANRVGATWLAYRVLDHGLSYEDAVKEAKTVGLKLPAYEEKARDYIKRQKKE